MRRSSSATKALVVLAKNREAIETSRGDERQQQTPQSFAALAVTRGVVAKHNQRLWRDLLCWALSAVVSCGGHTTAQD